jgi:DmsE family decaheme c-type cytochrome
MRSLPGFVAIGVALGLVSVTTLADEPAAALPTGNQRCLLCHPSVETHRVFSYHSDCMVCHTPDPAHVTTAGKNVVFPDSEKCLTCHRTGNPRLMNWAFAEHNRAELNCRDCHGIHTPKVKEINVGVWKADRISVLCVGCHRDVAARFNMPSHHPVKEGALGCVSCHDPHASRSTKLISRNDECFRCHQAIRGPKVFEHAPVVEDCGVCHNPHGAPQRRLLQVAQPVLCLQCHSQANNLHPQSGAILRQCTNCHGAIHGSQVDPRLKH